MNRLSKAVAVAAVAAGVVCTAAATPAAAYSGFTAEKFNKVQYGMTREQILEIAGPGACETGGIWGDSLQCWEHQNGDYNPYAGFDFNDKGQLDSRRQEFLINPVDPNMTLTKYNKVTVGMTLDEVYAIVGREACVLWSEAYPNYPAKDGWKLSIKCKKGTSISSGMAHFWFTNAILQGKSKSGIW